MDTIEEQIADSGYAILSNQDPHQASAIVFRRLGTIIKIQGRPEIDVLVPRLQATAPRGTYSEQFGTSKFPLHTDLAHWMIPPRYIMLRCIQGGSDVSTTVVDGWTLTHHFGEFRLRKSFTVPRKARGMGQQLLPLFSGGQRNCLRWDTVFLKPYDQFAGEICSEIESYLSTTAFHEIRLAQPGDILIIDNWRCLHGRSHVSEHSMSRIIDRCYLMELQ